jgi:two-component system cell cycle response regulator
MVDDDDDDDCTSVASRDELRAALAKAAEEKNKTARPWLMIVSGFGNAGKMYRLERELVIGRHAQCDVLLDQDGVSRRHAKLVLTPEGNVDVVDLESRNGTFINGERISRERLRDGDQIQIGNTTILKFSYKDAADEALQQNLFESATRDGLTGLANKRTFLDALGKEFAYGVRHSTKLSLIMFDVDHFKKINDTHGHPAGDVVLKQLAQLVASTARAEDIVARVGGEEFAILMRSAHAEGAHNCAERIRGEVERMVVEVDGKRIPVTISIGIATLSNRNVADAASLVAAADAHLYEAKRSGRNRVSAVQQTSSGRFAVLRPS